MRLRIPLLLMLLCLPTFGFEWQGRLSHITREFDSVDATRRRDLLRLLSGYGANEVRALLLHALEDDDPAVRREAAEVAGRVRLRPASAVLVDWLDDPDVASRVAAVRALGRIADAQVTPQLVRALGDADTDVRRAAVAALGSLGTRDAVVPLLGRLDDVDANVRSDACAVLARIGDSRAVVPLIGRAHDNAPEVRIAVFRALGELQDRRAVAPLVQGLRDDAPEARVAAISSLGALRDPNAIDALAEHVDAMDPSISRSVLYALGSIGGERATRLVIRQLNASNGNTPSTIAVIVSLATRAPDDEAKRAIVRGVADSFPTGVGGQRNGAGHAQALEQLARVTSIAEAVPVLLQRLQDRRGDLAQIENALAASGDERALLPLLERLREPSVRSLANTVTALTRYFELRPADGRAADPLLTALGAVPADSRSTVIALLGRVGARRAIPSIRPFLSANDRPTRLAAVVALGRIGDESGAVLLMPLLRDRDAEIRLRASDGIGTSASATLLSELIRRVAGDSLEDRAALLNAIGIGVEHLQFRNELTDATRAEAIATLARATESRDLNLAATSIDGLARIAHASATAHLIHALTSGNRRVRPSAAIALSRTNNETARAALREALSDRDTDVSAAAALALASNGEASDAPALVRLLSQRNWPVSTNAAFALARLSLRGALDRALVPELCSAIRARDPYARANVIVALAGLRVESCPDTNVTPTHYFAVENHRVVRIAAVHWVRQLVAASGESNQPLRTLLERCAESDSATSVSAACRMSAPAEYGASVDVTAYRADGQNLFARSLAAVRFEDGTAAIVRTSENARLRLWNVAHGEMEIDDALDVALEP